jgi:hypothetical protein
MQANMMRVAAFDMFSRRARYAISVSQGTKARFEAAISVDQTSWRPMCRFMTPTGRTPVTASETYKSRTC